ncbi:hypothetical protein Hden_3024 [Hyphomicrobium denitrificans ATCC 51888]|uniref:Uncharacterized protein n=1 Tax=Hyphomicrobium denitrificans (strain ATCC 51888 / DSM 1869 / NCIMB 11706 / TK 0415) TaxID=582899 RepID=D8JVG5_HYPDA|nr:hypothetical protein [Hyphomicrobium denitrificans]ADJ24819.1 hypothetical protein Hden_3024 [Hyphomicrobium denitrificans ATCC 51888]
MYDALTSTPVILAAAAAWFLGVVGTWASPRIARRIRLLREGHLARLARPPALIDDGPVSKAAVGVQPVARTSLPPPQQEAPPVAVSVATRAPQFDTSGAKVLHPAVAAERFAAWMRANGGTDYLWVGELDLNYLYFCKEENLFPVELKGLREFLYLLPGVYHDRPRIGGAQWERFRRRMGYWYADRGLDPPQRPVVVRILPAELVPAARVRDWPGEGRPESGSVAPRGRTAAVSGKKRSLSNADGRVHDRPDQGFGPASLPKAA